MQRIYPIFWMPGLYQKISGYMILILVSHQRFSSKPSMAPLPPWWGLPIRMASIMPLTAPELALVLYGRCKYPSQGLAHNVVTAALHPAHGMARRSTWLVE